MFPAPLCLILGWLLFRRPIASCQGLPHLRWVECFLSLLDLFAQPNISKFSAVLVTVNVLIFRMRMWRSPCLQANCSFVGNPLHFGVLCEPRCTSRRQDRPRSEGQGSIWDALSLEEVLHKIEKPGEHPSVEDFICILQKCRKQKNLVIARSLHKHIQGNAHKIYQSLGNHLVPLFVDCGSVFDAQQVFNHVVKRNVHSWTSLILGYAHCGESQHALDLYWAMQKDKVLPNSYTLVVLLKACVRLQEGRQVHDEIMRTGFESDLFAGSSLVDIYANCGSLLEAVKVFNILSVCNVVTWNALIAGYSEHGPSHEAIRCFEQMQLENVCPDDATFVSILKACSNIRGIEKGQIIHTEILQRGFEGDLLISNTLVDMYAKCGMVSEALLIFDQLAVRSVVSWNALIGGYVELGFDQDAIDCFDRMQAEGLFCNSVTFVCVIKACGSAYISDLGKKIHMEITLKGYEEDPVLCSTLVDMYSKNGLLAEAWASFCSSLSCRDAALWNCLIAGFAERGLIHKVLECLEKMQSQGVSPDEVTFANILRGGSSLRALDCGLALHTEVVMRGFAKDLFVGSGLVDMYAKHGFLMEAQAVFDQLLCRNVVSWTALIAGYADRGLGDTALTIFEQAEHQGIAPNAVMFVSALLSCNGIGSLKTGRKLHVEITKRGLENEAIVGNTLIDVYSKGCSIVEAKKVFESLFVRPIESWNAMIKGYGTNHKGDVALQVFENLQEQHVKPNSITLTCILYACSHASMVLRGRAIFELLKDKYGVVPTVDNYACMVDLLARSGHLYEAEKFLRTMPCSPSQDMWLAVLSACKTHAEGDVGQRCFEQLIHMDPDCAAPYLLLADIYISAGRLDEAHRIDKLRASLGAKKECGIVSRELYNNMNEFVHENGSSERLVSYRSSISNLVTNQFKVSLMKTPSIL